MLKTRRPCQQVLLSFQPTARPTDDERETEPPKSFQISDVPDVFDHR
jgi:hypothetical protein